MKEALRSAAEAPNVGGTEPLHETSWLEDCMDGPQGKRKRADGQLSGLAGEFFVAAELLKRGLQTSVTFGNAKAIDLLAYNPDTRRSFTVQVKTLRQRNWFLVDHGAVLPEHVYVFVVLNKPGRAVQYFVVPGAELAHRPERFGPGFQAANMPGIYATQLADFEDGWSVFDEVG